MLEPDGGHPIRTRGHATLLKGDGRSKIRRRIHYSGYSQDPIDVLGFRNNL